MQTINRNELTDEHDEVEETAFGAFEACVEFSGDGAGSPVCAACGWLDAEHGPAVAVVHALPRRVRGPLRTPKRLAS
jgi:hypothetical protein